ncbi:arginine--tRNA ligase [Marinococcus halophilus]|uniref:Arginine--tRNA ligase n=1 Tax=Marinococcus halophilus TaxID=1371 RepID=A0A510Y994_MARHA|nr:arginine--tRNA ligase [Marinococcus halophilus]OZT81869.1 arginine--tRNA ligase [Marinococcus halophilus]GEK59261.1 arginine--tRNA ligase [Marinococcus halophilus]
MNIMDQVKEQLKTEIAAAIEAAGLAREEEVPEIVLETPKEKSHGDFASNAAMKLASVAKKAPKAIAEDIVNHLNTDKASVKEIEIAGPGFINFFMDNRYLIDVIPEVLNQGADYGRSDVGNQKKVQVEFVSANPTGNLHLGHARGAAVGDSLCNILDFAGYDVTREYYINDAGNQIVNLARSVESRYFEALGMEMEMPEGGYQGADVRQFGEELASEQGDRFIRVEEEERLEFFREYGLKREIEKLKQDLEKFRVRFDVWYSETSLYTNGNVEETLQYLHDQGETYEEEGAVWFRSSRYGDDKDRVLVKNDGTYTYLLPDISYHRDKFDRGFEKVINIWGADHHGYIPRMEAAVQALGHDKEQLETQIIQMVNLFENGERVKMSKRTGKAVTLKDLMEEVGIDATRYFFAMRSPDTHMDFDLSLAKSQSNENPVYYVQYAHARLCSIFRQAEERGIIFDPRADLTPIHSEKELDVLKKIGEFPEEVAIAADKYAPHRMTTYLHELASAFHSFYNADRVMDAEDEPKTQARLVLAKAVQTTVQNGLDLIGVNAPETM